MSTHDPRTEAEKARAALRANDQMGMAPPESDMERRPSTTPETFGVHGREAENLEGHDGVTAGGEARRTSTNPAEHGPGTDNDPTTGGFGIADTEFGHSNSDMLSDLERVVTGRDGDAMSRGKK
ncbi:hypothetical protein [Salinarimonas soli]|uniref:Uncharacterized protein n=1 Tax=Salinarimonas soli TaxID=1638099 RepID=A0A5B2VDP0_9HYPH|nr:hypothetical protein [Salinarimonas soli]KAA2236895.1 hypothetical protein F0L46_12965 [Salinarimonas soli]